MNRSDLVEVPEEEAVAEKVRDPKAGQRGAVLSTLSVVIGMVIVAMGVAYLDGTAKSVQHARVQEQQAIVRAAAEGGLSVALHRFAAAASKGGEPVEREIMVGSTPVAVRAAQADGPGGVQVRSSAQSTVGKDTVALSLECEATVDAQGTVTVTQIRTLR